MAGDIFHPEGYLTRNVEVKVSHDTSKRERDFIQGRGFSTMGF